MTPEQVKQPNYRNLGKDLPRPKWQHLNRRIRAKRFGWLGDKFLKQKGD